MSPATAHPPTCHHRSAIYPPPGGAPTRRTSDAEWELIAGLVPVGGPRPARGGRPVSYARRDIIDAIRYVAHNGCVWRALPIDFPHHKLVYHYFTVWAANGTLSRIQNTLREQVRVAEGRQPTPTAGSIDAQSLRGAETVGRPSRGYDAGKKINGRKRHIIVDTTGLLLAILVTGAHEQDRDGGRPLLQALRMCFPGIRLIWADQGYSGALVEWAATSLNLTLQIVRKLTDQIGFVVLHRPMGRRTHIFLDRPMQTHRPRLGTTPTTPRRDGPMAMIIIMTRRLARYTTHPQPTAAKAA